MFYTFIPPEHEAERVRLYPSVEAALAAARDNRPLYQVALDLAAGRRLVVASASGIDPQVVGPEWMTAAQLHGDGSVTARGAIPKELFVGCIFVRR